MNAKTFLVEMLNCKSWHVCFLLLFSGCVPKKATSPVLPIESLPDIPCVNIGHQVAIQYFDTIPQSDLKTLERKGQMQTAALVSSYNVKYKGVFAKRIEYQIDSVNLVFLQRIDSLEADTIRSLIDKICFATPTDSIGLSENYSSLLISISNSAYIMIDDGEYGYSNIFDVSKRNGWFLFHTQLPGVSGTSAKYIKLYYFKVDLPNGTIIKRIKSQNMFEIRWLHDEG